MNTRLAEKAAACFEEGFSCSQAVFSSFAIEHGMEKDKALRASGAFGAGMAGRGETCGAVTGAFMAIGLKHAKIRADDNAARDFTYSLCADFIKRFEAEFGSIRCRDILGYDLKKPEEYQAAKEAGVFRSKCKVVVSRAAQIAADIS
jgi:C_GCAxxG_C_C family probable redox protein